MRRTRGPLEARLVDGVATAKHVTAPELVNELARHGRREIELQKAVLASFRAYGIIMWKQNREKAGRRYAPHFGFPGMPDLGGVLPGGRSIQVECKLPGAKPTPHQLGAMQLLARQGAFVCLVHDVSEAESKAKEAVR